VRNDPQRLGFRIDARDGAARAGVIQTSHGPIETPAFIPLATKGSVRGLDTDEVAGLGYQLILGNTYHLFDSPGPERIAAAGDLHGFMNWDQALITDSGGFQVFSLAHGGVANEVKGSGRKGDHGSEVEITEEGARFRSPRDGRELFLSPEVSMKIQAELGADIALPRRPRLHRPLDRADAPLARPLRRLARRARAVRPGALRHRPGRHP
jgi:queuine tRNA-ribosyltransferase